MAYQNIPVADGYQVVQQVANFASSIGWTVHRSSEQTDINGSALYYEVTLSFSGYPGYVTLAGYTGTGGIRLNGHRGYDASKRWWEQPDQFLVYDNDGNYQNDVDEYRTRCLVELRVTPILSVHLFGGTSPTPYLYAAIEKEPGYYRHMVIGHFEKFGTAMGGLFWDVSARETDIGYQTFYEFHRAPFAYSVSTYSTDYIFRGGCDTQDAQGNPKFCVFSGNRPGSHLPGGQWMNEWWSFHAGSPIQYNGRTGLMVPTVNVVTDGYRPFGTPPAFRYVDLEYFEAGDELVIGSETWKVFPWARRTPGVRISNNAAYYGPEYEATDKLGIAYLKD